MRFKPIILVCFLTGLALIVSCGDDSPTESSGATVNGTLSLPAEASGQPYYVLIDHDLDGGNGFVMAVTNTCGSGTTTAYSISGVPAGTYYVYAVVFVVGNPQDEPQAGDFVGVYGSTLSAPLPNPNAVVPSSGTVTFNITLEVMGG